MKVPKPNKLAAEGFAVGLASNAGYDASKHTYKHWKSKRNVSYPTTKTHTMGESCPVCNQGGKS